MGTEKRKSYNDEFMNSLNLPLIMERQINGITKKPDARIKVKSYNFSSCNAINSSY